MYKCFVPRLLWSFKYCSYCHQNIYECWLNIYLNLRWISLSAINYFIGSWFPYIGIFWSSLLTLAQCQTAHCAECIHVLKSDCSTIILCIFMIFTDLMYGMHGNIYTKSHEICRRIDEVTGAQTYKFDHIFTSLCTSGTYRHDFCLFILPGTNINYQITFRKNSDILPCYLQASETTLVQKLL